MTQYSAPTPCSLSVLDLVSLSEGDDRPGAFAKTIARAQTAEKLGYARYWIGEHHGSSTFLASATSIVMGQILAATSRITVASGGIMLPNHAPFIVAEQIGTLATMYPGRVEVGLGRAPGTDPATSHALRRRPADPGHFADEIVEFLSYVDMEESGENSPVPGSLLGQQSRRVYAPQLLSPHRSSVRAIPGEGTCPGTWVLGSSVNGARVAGELGLPFVVASHFAPSAAEAAIMAYRSTFNPDAPTAMISEPKIAASANVVVAPTDGEAQYLFTSMMSASARIVGGQPAPIDPPQQDLEAWKAFAPGKEGAVRASMALNFVGAPGKVVDGLRDLAQSWDLDEILVFTVLHDSTLVERSLELLVSQWNLS
ncbi:LLM class flavin-dependent oxidoreductase [Actinomyces vulturis]|uniref:LLM class flavin-dependent oxidoreductase n=1 Tax=Actinomyces vulturis TaxID=1857645 RepID=UPI00082FE37D|nr:LLM class flavin-dependent oxidoreductase [Actinomyces vulturis]